MSDENGATVPVNAAESTTTVVEQPREKTKFEKATETLENFVRDHLHNSIISQETPRMNRVRALIEQLKQEIESL